MKSSLVDDGLDVFAGLLIDATQKFVGQLTKPLVSRVDDTMDTLVDVLDEFVHSPSDVFDEQSQRHAAQHDPMRVIHSTMCNVIRTRDEDQNDVVHSLPIGLNMTSRHGFHLRR
jgi:hypothetical protein